MNAGSIAILIDGGFFLKRLPKLVPPKRCKMPEHIAGCIRQLCCNHIMTLTNCARSHWSRHIYRIFYYDAKPYDGKAHHPIDNRPINFTHSEIANQRKALFNYLKKQRKFALRLGKVSREHDWTIKPSLTKKLLRSREVLAMLNGMAEQESNDVVRFELTADQYRQLSATYQFWMNLDSHSVSLGLRQKGVDMRIGMDIASLALKKQVHTIVLVAGDSDFVPAAKLARREGIDFILDPLWQQINPDLFEHIDGLQSGLSRPEKLKGPNHQTKSLSELE